MSVVYGKEPAMFTTHFLEWDEGLNEHNKFVDLYDQRTDSQSPLKSSAQQQEEVVHSAFVVNLRKTGEVNIYRGYLRWFDQNWSVTLSSLNV